MSCWRAQLPSLSQCAPWTQPVHSLQPWTQLSHSASLLFLISNHTHLLLRSSVIIQLSHTRSYHYISLCSSVLPVHHHFAFMQDLPAICLGLITCYWPCLPLTHLLCHNPYLAIAFCPWLQIFPLYLLASVRLFLCLIGMSLLRKHCVLTYFLSCWTCGLRSFHQWVSLFPPSFVTRLLSSPATVSAAFIILPLNCLCSCSCTHLLAGSAAPQVKFSSYIIETLLALLQLTVLPFPACLTLLNIIIKVITNFTFALCSAFGSIHTCYNLAIDQVVCEDILPKMPLNITAVLNINSLTLQDEIIVQRWRFKKTTSMFLVVLVTWSAFFGLGAWRYFICKDCCLVPGVVAGYLSFQVLANAVSL